MSTDTTSTRRPRPRRSLNPTSLFVSVPEAAALLGVPRSSFYALVAARALPTVQLPTSSNTGNTRTWIKRSDLVRWVEQRTEPPLGAQPLS